MSVKSICVYCGSAFGNDPEFAEETKKLAKLLVDKNLHIVYGGGKNGLMGVFADAVIAYGGGITGIIAQPLIELEVQHRGVSDLRVTNNIHERKAMMSELSDAFIALPGGVGTIEELCEMVSWLQLGIHKKPCGALNVNGFFDHLIMLLDSCARSGFIRVELSKLLICKSDPSRLLSAMGL